MLLVFGFFLMVLGTYANLAAIEEKTSGTVHSDPKLLKHNPNEIKNLTVQGAEIETKTEKLFAKNVELNPPIKEPNEETRPKKIVQKNQIPALPVNKQTELRKDADINKDAIQREDIEMAIEAKTEPIVKKKFDETKELLKEKVDEIKNELEKRNQETQKLVMEKFEKIVEKLEHKDIPPVPEKDNLNIKIQETIIPTAAAKIVTVQKIDKMPKIQQKELKTEQLTEPNHINVEEKVIKKVEEMVDKVEKIEQTQQEAKQKKAQKEETVPLLPKQQHELVLENIEKIAQRIDKIQKVQQKEELAEAIDRKIAADRIFQAGENVKRNEEIQKTTIIIDKTAYVAHDRHPNANLAKEDEAAHNLVLKKIEEIVEKVEKIEQHQEKEMQHKQNEIEHKPPPPPALVNADETNNLVLKKIQAIDEKLEKIEQKQKIADDNVGELKEQNNGIQQTPINKTSISEKPNLVVNPLNKTKITPIVEQNGRKIIMPPLPLVRNATLNEQNVKNIPIEKNAQNGAKIEHTPPVKPSIEPKPMPNKKSDEENIIAIRRDLLAVNSSKLSSKDKIKNSTLPVENVETVRVKRALNTNFENCTQLINAIDRQLCHTMYLSQQENRKMNQIVEQVNPEATILDRNVILPDFDVKMIGRELKAINENVTDFR